MTTLLDPRKDPLRRVLKPGAWPPMDQRAWDVACSAGDVLEGDGIAAAWAPQTRHAVAKAYGRWLGWLGRQDLLDHSVGPTDRIERAAVERYVTDLQAAVAPITVVTYVHYLAMALTALNPSVDHRWVRDAAVRLKAFAKPARTKRNLLVASEQIFQYGVELMQEADSAPDMSAHRRATNFRDGLIIALLAARPIRRGNFAAIEIGLHLVQSAGGQAGACYRLRFAAAETKNRAPIEMALPAVLSPFIDRYLLHYRPMLDVTTGHWGGKRALIAVGARLWVSNYGSAMSAGAIYDRVTKLTKVKFGQAINPHLMRDCAATSTAIEDPDHIGITTSILGHTSLRTSERHYNHAQSLDAMRRHQANLASRRLMAKAITQKGARGALLAQE